MAEPKNRVGKIDAFISLGDWTWQRLVAPLLAGGVMTYFAVLTAFMQSWAPLSYATVGLVSFLVVHVAAAWGRSRRARAALDQSVAALNDRAASTSSVNPLWANYSKLRINLLDLASPMGAPIENRTFTDCELIGPATVVFAGCHIEGGFVDSEVVFFPGHVSTGGGKIAFVSCTFRRCVFYRVFCLAAHSERPQFMAQYPDLREIKTIA